MKLQDRRKLFIIEELWERYEDATEPFQVDELIFLSIDLELDIENELFAAWRIDSQEMIKQEIENRI